MRWSVGLTTVPQRRSDLLPRTLASLAAAGFPRLRLFVDGTEDGTLYAPFGQEVTCRAPALRTFGTWILGLAELFIREPQADRYALFQDDFLASANLRAYLERTTTQPRAYWNCLTFPSNQVLCPAGTIGWYEARTLDGGAVFASGIKEQTGRGAVALVFTRAAVLELLQQKDLIEKPLNAGDMAWRKIDGAIVNAMNKLGYKEMVHNPSLVLHTGSVSSMGNRRHPDATSWRGEAFDCLSLLAAHT